MHVRSSSAPIRVVTGQLPNPFYPLAVKFCYKTPAEGFWDILKTPSLVKTALAVCVPEFLVDHCLRTWTLASLASLRIHSIACVPCGSLSSDVDPREPSTTRYLACVPCGSLSSDVDPCEPRITHKYTHILPALCSLRLASPDPAPAIQNGLISPRDPCGS